MLLVSSCSCLYPIRWSQVLSWEWRCSWSSADRPVTAICLAIGTAFNANSIFHYSVGTSWWHHQMETFSALFPSQRPVMQCFDVSFDLCLNKQLRKQSWGWWFETPSSSLWCHCNVLDNESLLTWSYHIWQELQMAWFFPLSMWHLAMENWLFGPGWI